MDRGGSEGSKGGGDSRKRKGGKKKDEQPKERRSGYGVAALEEMIRDGVLAEQHNKQNPLSYGPPNQIPDGTMDGLSTTAIRPASPWSVGPLALPYHPSHSHLPMAYGYGNPARGGMNFGQFQSTPFRPPGVSGAASYPGPSNIRSHGASGAAYPNQNIIRPPGASGEASAPNPNNIRPPGASRPAYYPNLDIIRPPGDYGAASYPIPNNIWPMPNAHEIIRPPGAYGEASAYHNSNIIRNILLII